MTVLIRPIADAAAGEASYITVQAFSDSEVLTALRNGSGDLELISWHTAPEDFTITRGADSGTQAGEVGEVALTLVGRRAITAVRAGNGNLKLISWDVPPGLNTISRIWDTGSAAGEASQIAMTALNDMLVTAVRAGNDDLKLISWRLEPDGTMPRLHDSGSQAGEVGLVTIAPLDANNVVTAVRAGNGNLKLIGWSVASDGSIQRWGDSGDQAGEVSEIALMPATGGAPASDVLTAVQDGSGNLRLIAWRLSPTAGTIERLGDSGSEAGTASDIAIGSTVMPTGSPAILASMRNGSGNLTLIAFDLIDGTTGSAVIIRTGDNTNPANTDVTGTALASLEPGRIVSAIRVGGTLQLTTYTVSRAPTVLIRPIADAAAGEASYITVQAFSDSEVLTALRNGSGDLELISWHTAPEDFTITRGADSGTQAGEVGEVALTLVGRRAITAVRAGNGNLKLISWDVPPGLNTISRIWDTGSAAGEASQIAMTALNDMLVTAVRAGNDDLKLISWRLEPDGTMPRLHDSGSQAGEVGLVTIAPLDANNVVTAVRAGNGNLKLIGWSVASDGSIQRWGDSGDQAGEVSEIALMPATGGAPASDVLTAVQDGSGNLRLIAWRLSPTAGTIERLGDSGSEAGTASDIAIGSTVMPTGSPAILASMRNGSGNLTLIAFDLIDGTTGSAVIIRTGDNTNPANTDVTGTALASLEPGRIVSAIRVGGTLQLTTYTVSDASQTLAPADILTIRYENQGLPAIGDTSWAVRGSGSFPSYSGTFPTDKGMEWVQPRAHANEEYDDLSLVGCSGWVIVPNDSSADMPFDHPFGFDWEFHIVLDDDKNGYPALLSPASLTGDDRLEAAQALGLPVANGLLGVEWDQGLLPRSFRGQVNHGDRVATFGRWIIDQGHAFPDTASGFFRTEIHPPLLVATASVQQDSDGSEVTRVLLMSRPYLSGQTYCLDPADAYEDGTDDDGTFLDHLVKEIVKVMLLDSRRVEAHPKIKSHPFLGSHSLHMVVSPPPRPHGDYRLAVSFQFTVRDGCTVEVNPEGESVDIVVTLDSGKYSPSRLPERTERSYGPGELNKLAAGAGTDIIVGDAIVAAVEDALGSLLGPGLGLFLAAYVAYILSRGIITDEYAALPEIDIRNADSAVIDAAVDDIPDGTGIVADNSQAHPIFGWLEIGWVPARRKPPLTTATANQWISDVLTDPARARHLREDWRQLVLDEFAVTAEQRANLAGIPPDDARELQNAVALVVDQGGTIRLERESERSRGRLIVAPEPVGPVTAELSVGVFHCTYNAHCRNWRCGWGPARK